MGNNAGTSGETVRRVAVSAVFGLSLAWSVGTVAAPLETYGRLPMIEQVTISPDGKTIAFAVTDGDRRVVLVKDIATGKLLEGLRCGEQKVRDIRFAGDDDLIITSSVTGFISFVESPREESYMAEDFNLKTRRQRSLLANFRPETVDILNTVDTLPEVRRIGGKTELFVEGTKFVDHQGQSTLFRIDVQDGSSSVAAEGDSDTSGFAVGPDGPLAEDLFDGSTGQWKLRRVDGGRHDVIRKDVSLGEPPALVGTGRDGVSLLVRLSHDHVSHLIEVDQKGQQVGAELPMGDATGLWYDTDGSKLIGLSRLEGDDGRYIFFDPHDQAVWNATVKAFPDSRVSLIDFDAARDKIIVRVDSPTEGPSYALVDLTTKKAAWIGDEYDGLKQGDVGAVRTVTFHAKDGLAISGYVTLPPGKPEKALPLVVLVHGGPEARDTPGFDWWAQALASRGYAVLQVNYRGSGGLGWPFLSAGFDQWGRKMQTDLSDGVRYLAGEGTIDPKRVCIVGASYGGYAALAGATLDTGVYRCAASIAGPSDLARMINWDKSKESHDSGASTQRYWTRYMGAMSTLDAISPVKHVEAVTVPILLIHGKDDTVVDYQQSQIMADALARAGKLFDFVTLKAEDHWLSHGATRLQMLQAVTAFLEKNNPPA